MDKVTTNLDAVYCLGAFSQFVWIPRQRMLWKRQDCMPYFRQKASTEFSSFHWALRRRICDLIFTRGYGHVFLCTKCGWKIARLIFPVATLSESGGARFLCRLGQPNVYWEWIVHSRFLTKLFKWNVVLLKFLLCHRKIFLVRKKSGVLNVYKIHDFFSGLRDLKREEQRR